MNRDLNAVFHFWENFECQNGLSRKPPCNCLRIRKDYPTTGVLKHRNLRLIGIRKDYPTTGVLKLILYCHSPLLIVFIRKDYPTTGVLKPTTWSLL